MFTPCSNILAALRNCARDDIGGRPGDYVDAAFLSRVPLGQGGVFADNCFAERAAFIAALSLVLGIFVLVELLLRMGW